MVEELPDVQAVVHAARRHGARGADALLVVGEAAELRAVGRSPPRRDASSHASLTVRVWLEQGRRGDATGRPDDADRLLAEAAARARSTPPDPVGGPVGRLQAAPRGLGIDDLRHDQITEEDRVEVVTTNLRAMVRQAGVTTASSWYREAREVRRFANTQGLALEAAHTRYEAGGELELRVGDDRLRLDDVIAGRGFASIACLPLGAQLAQRAAALSREPVALEGPQRVLLPPRTVGRLVAWLAPLFRADDLARGTSFVARAGPEPLFHRRLHLVDDGGLHGGLHTRGFDDRGVAPVPVTLLREGHVAGRYLDPETARRLDARPTGHVVRDPDGVDACTPANLLLNSGTRSASAWLGEQDRVVVEVDDLGDLSGIDPRTGDLALVVDGVAWERHRCLGSVRRVRLHGNLVDALRSVVAVASDTDRVLHVDAPALLVDGLSIG